MDLNGFQNLLSNSAFAGFFNCRQLKIAQLNALVRLLIEANLTFVLEFSEGTHSSKPVAVIEIAINPISSIGFEFEIC